MRAMSTLLILLVAAASAPAQDPPPEPPRLHFSWSATAQQDTLYAAASGWTQCYLWVHPSPLRHDFVGFWGTLFQSAAVQVHGWRPVGEGGGEEHAWDPYADEARLAYLGAPCVDETGPRVVAEFDVWIDTAMLDLPGFKPSLLGIRPEGETSLDPLVFYRVNYDDPCHHFSEGFDAATNRLVVKAQAVPAQGATFGALKAAYR
jgi:hypothetical protein